MLLSELRLKWKGNQLYTRKLMEAIPPDGWALQPTASSKTFLSQCTHITTWTRTHSRFVTGVTLPKPAVKTPEDIFQALDEGFAAIRDYLDLATEEDLAEIVDVFYGKRSRAFILAVMDNHLAHHRGQMVVYLRMAGGKPPGYRGW